jgi:hypothetical protein
LASGSCKGIFAVISFTRTTSVQWREEERLLTFVVVPCRSLHPSRSQIVGILMPEQKDKLAQLDEKRESRLQKRIDHLNGANS